VDILVRAIITSCKRDPAGNPIGFGYSCSRGRISWWAFRLVCSESHYSTYLF
jgi:hypothetical protein